MSLRRLAGRLVGAALLAFVPLAFAGQAAAQELRIGLRNEPTGCPIGFHADVIATAKRDLKPGEMLDGEGGYTVYGKLFPSEKSTGLGSLPLGLAHNVKLLKPIKAGQSLTYADVQMDESLTAVKLRREMERLFAPAAAKIAAQ